MYNIFRDHLGTITHLKTGSTISEYSFDAWGRRRDKDDWTYTLSGEPALFADRGFTAHEYLEDFKLYNMNGRMYDPVVGRFLSPDPFIQAPDFSQNFNRYSYGLNNPLRYNDLSGYTWGIFKPFAKFGKWVWNDALPALDPVVLMQKLNDKTEKLREKMDKLGIPDFSIGGSVNLDRNVHARADVMGQEVFNTQNIDRSNAGPKVSQMLDEVRGAWWEASFSSNNNGISNVLNGVSVGFNISIPETNLNSGFSATLLSDHERNYAIAITLMSRPEKPGVELGASISRVRIISNTGNPVSFGDLRGYGEQYNAGFLIFEYSIGGSPDRVRSKASPYKIENFGLAFGFPVTLSGYSTYTWIFPLY